MTFNNANSYTVSGGNTLTLNNNGTAFINVLAGTHTVSAALDLANNLSIIAAGGTSLTISGVIETGAGRTVSIDGGGTVTFGGTDANTYTGLTTVAGGTLNLNKTAGQDAIGAGGLQIDSGATATLLASNQIVDTATVLANGTFNLGTFSETIGALNGFGSVVVGSGSILTVGAANNLSSTFEGVISGAGTIVKAGTGTLTLTRHQHFRWRRSDRGYQWRDPGNHFGRHSRKLGQQRYPN